MERQEEFRRTLKNYLKGLKDNLTIIEDQRNSIWALVQLFQTIDTYGEETMEELMAQAREAQMTRVLPYLMTLQGMMGCILRSSYNQTPPDRPVTADTIILGGNFNIDEAPASYWLEHESQARSTKLREGNFNAWHVVHDYQAKRTVEGWTQKLLKTIRILEQNMNH